LLCKLAVYAAVELLEQASVSLTLETARSRNLAFAHFYSFSKLPISALHETDGKGTVEKVDYFFDSPASFRKLEIEPKK